MANDLSDTVRDALGHMVREAIKNVGDASPTKNGGSGPFKGMKGLAAGAGLAAAAPLAKKGVDAVRANGGLPTPSLGGAASKVASMASPKQAASKAASKAGDKVGSNLKDAVTSKVDEAGGAGGLVKEAASGLLPGGGDSDSDSGKGGMPGVGKGRRMPVQQAVDVAVPLETAYNQWTQFEDWPEFMHRVTRVSQEDDCSISFATKIWGKTKEFKADIETQRPDERIKWKVSEGITHTGVVSFHELAPNLTRIELNIDVDPGSLIEKAARGMRHIKRAVRADLHRFKAFIEMQELETGAWRGVIEDGELVEEHDESYDEERDYSEVDDLYGEQSSDDDDDDEDEDDDEQGSEPTSEGDEDEDEDEDEGSRRRSPNGRSKTRTAASSASRSSRTAGSGSRSRSGSSKSRSSGSRSSRSGSSKSGSSSSGSSRSGSSKSGSSKASSSKSGSSRGSSNGKSTASRSRSSKSTSNGKSGGSGSKSSGRSRSSSGGSSKRRQASSRS
jgi:uncharacterized membrane protein